MGQRLRRLKLERACAASVMQRPVEALIEPRRNMLAQLSARVDRALPLTWQKARTRLDHAAASLRALDPEAVLERGYVILSNEWGIVKSVADTSVGERVSIRMTDGRVGAEVTSIQPKGGSL